MNGKIISQKEIKRKYDKKGDCIKTYHDLKIQIGFFEITAHIGMVLSRQQWIEAGKFASWINNGKVIKSFNQKEVD